MAVREVKIALIVGCTADRPWAATDTYPLDRCGTEGNEGNKGPDRVTARGAVRAAQVGRCAALRARTPAGRPRETVVKVSVLCFFREGVITSTTV